MAENFLAMIRGERRGIWPSCARLGLWLLSVPYGLGVRLRNWALDKGWKKTIAVSVPVISVGNLTTGGTGKTPCVEYVARFYRERDLRVALLSRGYGACRGRNDEAQVLEENLPDVPHLQGPDRVALAHLALEELESEVLVLDDGFQHRRLRRDLDIILIDATDPWGKGYLLPRGLLREPMSSLRRGHLAMLTRCDLVERAILDQIRTRIAHVSPNMPIVETAHQPTCWVNSTSGTQPLANLEGRPIGAFCGLGNPEGFRRTLHQLRLDVVGWRVFPDHHAYSRDDIESLRSWARQLPKGAALATTQKDLVKIQLERLGDRDLWALQIRLAILKGKDVLEEKLQEAVQQDAVQQSKPRRGG